MPLREIKSRDTPKKADDGDNDGDMTEVMMIMMMMRMMMIRMMMMTIMMMAIGTQKYVNSYDMLKRQKYIVKDDDIQSE